MIRKINKVKYIIELGEVSKEVSDVLILWSTKTLSQGDKIWKKINLEAGSILYEEALAALTQYGFKDFNEQLILPPSHCIFTKGGRLDVYFIIHSVLPDKRIKLEEENKLMLLIRALNNITMLSQGLTYNTVPVYSLVFYPIPEDVYGKITNKELNVFFESILSIKNYKEIKIVCNTKEEYEMYSSYFEKKYIPLWERIVNKLFNNKF